MRLRTLVQVVAFAALATAGAASEDLGRFSVVRVEPTKTSIYIGSVSMTMSPFLRKSDVFISNYQARVFPYFFYNENGRLSITIPDSGLQQLSHGQAITFTGKGINDDGQARMVDGKATPSGPNDGAIKVRVYVSRKIALVFNTTYHLEPQKAAQPSAH